MGGFSCERENLEFEGVQPPKEMNNNDRPNRHEHMCIKLHSNCPKVTLKGLHRRLKRLECVLGAYTDDLGDEGVVDANIVVLELAHLRIVTPRTVDSSLQRRHIPTV